MSSRRFTRALAAGLLAVLLLSASLASTQGASKAPDVVIVYAEGAGFPFADPEASTLPGLRRLRGMGRPFDAAFAPDSNWQGAFESTLGGARGRALALPAALARGGYATTLVGPSAATPGFARAVPANLDATAGEVLKALSAAAGKPALVVAKLDLRGVPGGVAPAGAAAPPIESPAIALSDRAPLDPLGLTVLPPPRKASDRASLQAQRVAAFAALDRTVSAILDGIGKAGRLNRTVVAVVSAGPAPAPERAAPPRPDLLFEDWLRGLLVIVSPGLSAPGTPAAGLARLDDLAPTVARLAGLSLAGTDGLDLGPALKDPAAVVRNSVLTSADRMPPRIGRSLRTAQFRYTLWPDGSEELFDEEADPREWTNLADDAAARSRKTELARRLAAERPRAQPARPARAAPGPRPNVLLIIGDDLTSQYGDFADVKTPNLDRLRARGRVFDRAYAPAPFCVPSRAAFLSGLSPARLELQHDNPYPDVFTAKIPLIQEQFRASGYFTASVGKVWDSQPGEKRGWDLNEWQPALPMGLEEKPAKMIPGLSVEAGPTDNPDEAEGDGRRARFAARVLGEKRAQPLFLAVGLVRPHVAWIAPQKYFDLYPPASIRFQPAPRGDTSDIPAIAIKNRPQELPGVMLAGREPGGFSDRAAEARQAIAAYLACVTFMDAQLGVILDALDRDDRWKDTIVVLLGDNGHHFGDHGGLWRKNTLFEESLRVPLVIAAPGLTQPGVATSSLADLLDVYPTLVDLTGIARPATLDGTSLAPILADPRVSVQDAVVQYRPAEAPRTGFSLRTARYRYTIWPDGSEELFDLRADPSGRKDLGRDPAQASVRRTLRAQIATLVKPAS